MKQKTILGQSAILLLLGISLIGLVFYTPDQAGNPAAGSFFKTALAASWGKLLDLPAVWCSFKIILLSLGLFLVIEVVATILSLLKHKRLSWLAYSLHMFPGVGLLLGGYCLLKSLL